MPTTYCGEQTAAVADRPINDGASAAVAQIVSSLHAFPPDTIKGKLRTAERVTQKCQLL